MLNSEKHEKGTVSKTRLNLIQIKPSPTTPSVPSVHSHYWKLCRGTLIRGGAKRQELDSQQARTSKWRRGQVYRDWEGGTGDDFRWCTPTMCKLELLWLTFSRASGFGRVERSVNASGRLGSFQWHDSWDTKTFFLGLGLFTNFPSCLYLERKVSAWTEQVNQGSAWSAREKEWFSAQEFFGHMFELVNMVDENESVLCKLAYFH